jgi:hypothetical protein
MCKLCMLRIAATAAYLDGTRTAMRRFIKMARAADDAPRRATRTDVVNMLKLIAGLSKRQAKK